MSIIFIVVSFIGAFVIPADEPASIYIIFFLFFGFGIFLLFDILYYRVLALNKEKLPLSARNKNYGRVIFVVGILALCCVLFMSLAALYAYLSDPDAFVVRQRSFFVAFLVTMLLTGVSFIFVLAGYNRAKKENRQIMNTYINEIGTL